MKPFLLLLCSLLLLTSCASLLSTHAVLDQPRPLFQNQPVSSANKRYTELLTLSPELLKTTHHLGRPQLYLESQDLKSHLIITYYLKHQKSYAFRKAIGQNSYQESGAKKLSAKELRALKAIRNLVEVTST